MTMTTSTKTIQIITPNWPAPSNICAFTTTRHEGFSMGVYSSFNLGKHCGDEEAHVLANRELLQTQFHLPKTSKWLTQKHTPIVTAFDDYTYPEEADGLYANSPQQACMILTADCLPILLCNSQGTEIAALHAGWRGLAAGVITNGVKHFQSEPQTILAWLGPAISQTHFEVGHEVREAFLNKNPVNDMAFIPSLAPNKWMANLYALARIELQQLGITAIYGGDHCTYSENNTFYSYRRDGGHTGRMASLIWLRGS